MAYRPKIYPSAKVSDYIKNRAENIENELHIFMNLLEITEKNLIENTVCGQFADGKMIYKYNGKDFLTLEPLKWEGQSGNYIKAGYRIIRNYIDWEEIG